MQSLEIERPKEGPDRESRMHITGVICSLFNPSYDYVFCTAFQRVQSFSSLAKLLFLDG